ncbi:MAG: response regulator [Acidobacteria bacterium]|uniref:histidine kinase n=1 Tax=Candidatus Polarisedimenticola svalbardensis TaxID=2886004 RepID=A0A8J6XWH8_9BACT|nr:response regulator [Candidatus Polarisedimenticola svalbardensis]
MRLGVHALVRWIFLLSASYLAMQSEVNGFAGALFTMVLLAGAIVVHFLPGRLAAGPRFHWSLLFFDTVLVALSLLVLLPGEPVLLATFFLGSLVAVMTAESPGLAMGGLAAAGLYVAITSGIGGGASAPAQTARVLFLLGAGYYFLFSLRSMNRTARAVSLAGREGRQLKALLQITDAISSSLEIKTVMQRIVREVGGMVETSNCSILLCDDRQSTGFVVASDQDPNADMLQINLNEYPELREAIVTGETVIVRDTAEDPIVEDVRAVLQAKGYRTMLILPLIFGGDVLGTLYLRAGRERPFTEEEIRFCKAAAGASANALQNAKLFEEVRSEALLHKATGEKLRRLLDCSPDMIVATDASGVIIEFNGAASSATDLGEEQARGRTLATVLNAPSLAADPEHQGVVEADITFEDSRGEPRDLSLVSAPLTGAGRVWIGRDVTHLNRVERSLAQAERLSTLGEVVAGVAHELNNPLSSVLGYSELARKSSENPALLRDLTRVVDSARRCKKIVHNLLGFARENNAEKKYSDLNSCVRRVLDLRTYNLRAARADLETDLAPDLPSTLFDFQQIEQVVMNLLANAEHAVTGQEKEGVLKLRTWHESGTICLEVSDNGPGIPAPARSRVFDPFFTTKGIGQGTGLGLSVSFGIVREHDGSLELMPEPAGGGACFRLSLPVTAMPEPAPGDVAGGVEPPARCFEGRRILVAEDEPLVLELFTRVLEGDGASVTRAADGREAWDQLVAGEFDLVVADLRMPRMDGQELYERVAEEMPEMIRRFVFATGDMASEATLAFLEGLPNGILVKPLQVETVRHVLGKALSSSH